MSRQCIKSYAFFDLETTGLPDHEFNKTKITEICLVASSKENILRTEKNRLPRVLNKLSFCVNPFKQISADSTRITGLDNFLLENENKFDQNFVQLLNHFVLQLPQPVCLVAHNGDKFDFPIIQKQLQSLGATLPDDLTCVDSLPFFRWYEDYLQQEKLNEPKPLVNEEDEAKEENKSKATSSSENGKYVNGQNLLLVPDTPSSLCAKVTLSNALPLKHDAIRSELTSFTDEIEGIDPLNRPALENKTVHPDITVFTSDIVNINMELKAEDVKEKQKINESTPSNRKTIIKKELFAKKLINYGSNSSITPPSKRQLFTPENSKTLVNPYKRLKFTLTAVHERFFDKEPNKSHYAESDAIALMKCVVASKMEFFEYAEQNAKLFKDIKPIGL